MKVFSKKNKNEKQQHEQNLCENKNDKSLPLALENAKTVVEKKKSKEVQKTKLKTTAKKKTLEVAEVSTVIENGGTSSFKRNLRPRRSSSMLDDYIIMTDSDEYDEKSDPTPEVKKIETPKQFSTKTTIAGDLKSQKCKINAEESAKKNLKINKTELKPKKDLNKINSELINSFSKSKINLVKCDKELEIKNNKSTAADKKTEKSSKNKTETVVITKEPKTTGEGSKNAGKKVPLSNKQQQLVKKKNISNKKKSKLDLYNNNKKQSTLSSSSSTIIGITSQTKEELLEHMAANFDAKLTTAKEDVEKAADKVVIAATTTKESCAVKVEKKIIEKKVANNKSEHKQDLKKVSKTENAMVVAKEENFVRKVENVAVMAIDKVKKTEIQELFNKVEKEECPKALNKVEKTESLMVPSFSKVEKTESLTVPSFSKIEKTESLAVPMFNKVEKMESMTVPSFNKVEKIESMTVPFNEVDKVENIVFQTIAKDLFLGQQKEIKIAMPDYFSSKNFQLSNRFKQDDGLSVLSEICSALPRFNEPFVASHQLLNKLPTTTGESSFVKYVPSPPITILTTSGNIEKKDEKLSVLPPPLPPSFESRTMKIVNLARGSSNITPAKTQDKKDLASSWRQAFKNVKIPKNGLTSAAVSVGNNLIAWTKKKQSSDGTQTPPLKTNVDSMDSGSDLKEVMADNIDDQAVFKTTLQSSVRPINGLVEKPSYSSMCQKTISNNNELKTTSEVFDSKKALNSPYLAKTTILNSTKYDLKFEKRYSTAVTTTTPVTTVDKPPRPPKEFVADVSSSDDQSPEKKIFYQRRLSTTHSCSGNSSDAFSPDNETSVYAFQPDLPVASTPFRRNKPQSPAKSRTVSPNTSIAVSIIKQCSTIMSYYKCKLINDLWLVFLGEVIFQRFPCFS